MLQYLLLLYAALSLAKILDPAASDNLVVYFGHSPGNANASLLDVCNQESVDIVVLGFIRGFNGLNLLPTFDITKTCRSTAITKSGSIPGCTVFAQDIVACQKLGIKVMLSVGGSVSSTSFNTSADAADAAVTLWNLFGSGTTSTTKRPFGNVTLDGFDIGELLCSVPEPKIVVSTTDIYEDQESGSPMYYGTFAATFRSFVNTAPKDYYISAVPSCANNTVVYSTKFYSYIDFVWPRFWNAQSCNVGSSNFAAVLAAWSKQLDWQVGVDSFYPRLYVGTIDFDSGSTSGGYLDPYNFTQRTIHAACNVRDRFGGVMLWDGTNGLTTFDNDGNFMEIVKSSLTHEASCFSGTHDNNYGTASLSSRVLLSRAAECHE